MTHISLSNSQAAEICIQAFNVAKTELEDSITIPNHTSSIINYDGFSFIKISNIYLGDWFGAIDIVFNLNGKDYMFTVEQSIDGEYCSAFDPNYIHTATEIKTI